MTRLIWTADGPKVRSGRLGACLVHISVTDAKGQLTDLVRRAEGGDDIVLTRHGHAIVRLVPVAPAFDPRARRALMEAVGRSGAARAMAGVSAAESQDFLYDEESLPR